MISSYWHSLPKALRIPLTVVGIAAAGVVFFLVFGYLVMWLWNHVLAVVFDIPSVTFWQALGLFVLAKLFFGFGGGGQGGERKKRRERRHAGQTEDRSGEWPQTDYAFKAYWREEGKRAYEAYLASKREAEGSDERA